MLVGFIEKVARISGLEIPDGQFISINFLGSAAIRRLNERFLGHDRVTDVICFDYRDDKLQGGDVAVEIFVCPELAKSVAGEIHGASFASEILLYIVHGILHAAGEDDISPILAKSMRLKEKYVLGEALMGFSMGNFFSWPGSKADQLSDGKRKISNKTNEKNRL
jgi:rRNA maturation RNase YbeY